MSTAAPEPAPDSVPDSVPVDREPVGEHVAGDVGVRGVVDPANLRRAPRYKGFFVVGVVVGLVGGLAFGLYLLHTFDPARDQALGKPGVWLTVTVLGTTALTTLITGLVVNAIDRRSIHRRDARRSM